MSDLTKCSAKGKRCVILKVFIRCQFMMMEDSQRFFRDALIRESNIVRLARLLIWACRHQRDTSLAQLGELVAITDSF